MDVENMKFEDEETYKMYVDYLLTMDQLSEWPWFNLETSVKTIFFTKNTLSSRLISYIKWHLLRSRYCVYIYMWSDSLPDSCCGTHLLPRHMESLAVQSPQEPAPVVASATNRILAGILGPRDKLATYNTCFTMFYLYIYIYLRSCW